MRVHGQGPVMKVPSVRAGHARAEAPTHPSQQATVKTHVSAIIAKLGVQDRVGAAVYTLQHNLV